MLQLMLARGSSRVGQVFGGNVGGNLFAVDLEPLCPEAHLLDGHASSAAQDLRQGGMVGTQEGDKGAQRVTRVFRPTFLIFLFQFRPKGPFQHHAISIIQGNEAPIGRQPIAAGKRGNVTPHQNWRPLVALTS